MKRISSSANRYSLYGALFGLAFPVISFLMVRLLNSSLNTLLIVIATAPVFLGIFARFAGVRQDRINEVNRGLEETVARRTNSIRNLLDVSGEGYLSFGPDFLVKAEYSLACLDIFGSDIAGASIDSLLFDNESEAEEFRQGLSLFFSGKSRGDVIFDLLEKETEKNDKVLEFDFKVIGEAEVLCAVKDVSDHRALAEVMDRDSREQQIVFQVISHSKYFSSFTQEADDLFERFDAIDGSSGAGEFEVLQRKVHTFKGNASFFNFEATQSVAHDLEYFIADRIVLGEDISLDDSALALKQAYYNEVEIVERRLGSSWLGESDTVSIPITKFKGLEHYVRKSYPGDGKLLSALKTFRTVPLASLFVRFPDMADRIAEQLGRQILPLTVEGGHFPVLPERYEQLVGSYVHIIRNMIDHGIESPSDRELKNKSPEGNLSITLDAAQGFVTMSFSDDGGGLSAQAITRKAVESGLIEEGEAPSKKELYSMLFRHDFSTADEVSNISGRGHGLSAVKDEVDRLGGKISLSSSTGKGTIFKIAIPNRRENERKS